MLGVRTLMLSAYSFPASLYRAGVVRPDPDWVAPEGRERDWSAAWRMHNVGILLYYADKHPGCGKRQKMDVDAMVARWKTAVVGLSVAHTKDEADRHEASIEACLTPLLAAPIAQLREFAPKLAVALRDDERVPFLVWRAMEAWVELMKNAPDEEVIELKTRLAQEIVEMVEADVKAQLPEAIVRALQWRSTQALEEVKAVVAEEKAAGRPVRLRGRESCLFLEAGGTEERPKVCVQI